MRLPTDAHIGYLFDRLRRHARHRQVTDTNPTATLAELESALVSALRRARTGTLALDSTGVPSSEVPASRLGASGGGGCILVVDEYGRDDAVPATMVEITAILALEEHLERDRLAEDVAAAHRHLVAAIDHLAALQTRLNLIARRSSPLSRSEEGGAGSCLACGRMVTGAAEDRLKRGLGPCCYSSWTRMGRPDVVAFSATREKAS